MPAAAGKMPALPAEHPARAGSLYAKIAPVTFSAPICRHVLSPLRRLGLPLRFFGCVAVLVFAAGCTADRAHQLVVSVPEQRLLLLRNGQPLATYPVSTSKFALGDTEGSRGTPLGELEVARKIGGGLAPGAVLKHREPTGEVLAVDAPGRDPIVTRILWLRGNEESNRNAFERYIYIHGTPEERTIGTPASFGCVRMKSRDVIALYDTVGVGARVYIKNEPMLTAARPYLKPATNVAAATR